MLANLEWLSYAVFYPDVGDEGYNPERPEGRPGEIKGLRDDAPQWAKDEYARVCAAEKNGEKL